MARLQHPQTDIENLVADLAAKASSGSLSAHEAAVSGVHGITTAGAALLDDANAGAQRTTLGLGSAAIEAAGTFATDAELSDHAADTTSVHGIADTSALLTSASIPTLASGTWTPTRSAEANHDANVTLSLCHYCRVGDEVIFGGRFTFNPTLAATVTSFEMTLPVASNFAAAENASGTAWCGAIAGMGAEIIAVAANDTMKVFWVSSDINSNTWSFSGSYRVL